jgi:hypothetical protein
MHKLNQDISDWKLKCSKDIVIFAPRELKRIKGISKEEYLRRVYQKKNM